MRLLQKIAAIQFLLYSGLLRFARNDGLVCHWINMLIALKTCTPRFINIKYCFIFDKIIFN